MIFLILAAPFAGAAPPPPPVAPVVPVTDDYFGTKVTDNYRYFEDLKDPKVQAWMKGQADYARAVLDSLPGRKALLERITVLDQSQVAVFDVQQRGQRYFYQKRLPEDQVPKLYYRDSLEGEEHLILDPACFGTTAAHAALDFYTPSWDGQLLVYGISLGGSEDSTLRVLEVAGKRTFQESIDRTSLSVVAWAPDNRGFFYLRFNEPTPGMKPSERLYNARTYRHVLGEHRAVTAIRWCSVVVCPPVSKSPRARQPTCWYGPTARMRSPSRTRTWIKIPRRFMSCDATASTAPRHPGARSRT